MAENDTIILDTDLVYWLICECNSFDEAIDLLSHGAIVYTNNRLCITELIDTVLTEL